MKLTKGADLTPAQRAEVLRAFVHRNTVEHSHLPLGMAPPITDAEWIAEHAFYITVKGRLANRPGFCEPHYLAEED